MENVNLTRRQQRRATMIALASSMVLGQIMTNAALAHGTKPHPGAGKSVPPEQKEWGIAGSMQSVNRSVNILMSDDMRFNPSHVSVRLNETLRFQVSNRGRVMHEMVIGTEAELNHHAEMMKKHPNMEHDEPYMAHVPPGTTADLIWTFNRPGRFNFACLLPGHFEAGMKGTIEVTP